MAEPTAGSAGSIPVARNSCSVNSVVSQVGEPAERHVPSDC